MTAGQLPMDVALTDLRRLPLPAALFRIGVPCTRLCGGQMLLAWDLDGIPYLDCLQCGRQEELV